MFYLIKERLVKCEAEELKKCNRKLQYVAVLTTEQWAEQRECFEMGIDMEINTSEILGTKIEVNYDSLTGTFKIPDREDLDADDRVFAFAMDERGIVFIDDSDTVSELIDKITRIKYWRFPSLERFLYDFLEMIVHDDLRLMERYECDLDAVEKEILSGADEECLQKINLIRGDVRQLRINYEQLIDLGQELEENENGFFPEAHERFFHLFLNRMARLHDAAASLRDYIMQIRDLYHAQLDARQNRIMALLTVVTSIFLPLTLIAGWYGMNFRYMPELQWKWAYPVVIGVSVLIVVVSLWFFRKKKWL